MLSRICSNSQYNPIIIDALSDHLAFGDLLRDSLVYTHFWYSKNFKIDPHRDELLRSQQAKVVLFCEYFILSLLDKDPWDILDQVCDIKPIINLK